MTNLTVDKKQDWFLLSMRREADYLIVKLERQLILCDADQQDLDIVEGITKVIVAWGSLLNNDISYHGISRRAINNVQLTGRVDSVTLNNDNIETFDMKLNVMSDRIVSELKMLVAKLILHLD